MSAKPGSEECTPAKPNLYAVHVMNQTERKWQDSLNAITTAT